GIHREQAQRRLAVDEDDVVLPRHLAEDAGEDRLAGHLVDEVDLGGGEIDVGRDDVQPLDRGVDDRLTRVALRVQEQIVDGGDVVRRDSQTCRQGALRIEVDGQNFAPVLCEGRGEIDGGRGLADAALLVAQRDDARRTVCRERCRGREPSIRTPCGPDRDFVLRLLSHSPPLRRARSIIATTPPALCGIPGDPRFSRQNDARRR
ncbi:hypothetical protein ABE10_01280, partial [Bacillus toyonensis]|nr:hypothetical protein [Bacillus toyonensis]